MNGKKGDHPLTDIIHWKIRRFSPAVDALITEIVQLGGESELERRFNVFEPPPLEQFEPALLQMRDHLRRKPKNADGKFELPLSFTPRQHGL
jgi:hypothetical protein